LRCGTRWTFPRAAFSVLHNEQAVFRAEPEMARAGHRKRLGLDWIAFTVSLKEVFRGVGRVLGGSLLAEVRRCRRRAGG
jgi:hypothetical protein